MDPNFNHAFSSPIPSSSSHSSESSSTFSKIQYYGLRKQNFFKKFRRDISQLTSYIYSVSPSMVAIHDIMSIFRIMQFLLPCFIPSYISFWKSGSVDQIVMNVLAVPCYFIPPNNIFQAAHYLIIAYIIIQSIVIFLFIGSSYYFKKKAKLPNFIPKFLYFYNSTFGYYFHPIVIFILCEGLSYLTTPETREKIILQRFITIHSLAFICAIFNFFFMYMFQSQTLAFISTSLASTAAPPQYIFFIATILINLLFGLGVNLAKKFKIAIFSINFCLYLLAATSVFTYGGYIKTLISNIVLSSSLTGAVFTLVDLIFIILDKNGTLALFFCFIAFFILMLILNYFILQKIRINCIKTLDSIMNNKDLFSLIKSPHKFFQLTMCGIKFAHPIVIDLSIFTLAVDKWDSNQYVYYFFAKFVAIYPEESNTLKYIYKAIKLSQLKGTAIRCIKEQTQFIMRQRETNLSSELRKKIGLIKRQNLLAKHKLGHVWDVVIRGNLNEIEIATRRAIESINEENTDIKHLMHEYPNNRNVTHLYGVFLNELMADHALSHEMHEKTRMLAPGLISSVDPTHEYGLKMFPNLPKSIKMQNDPLMSSAADFQSFSLELNKSNYTKERENYLDQIAGIKTNIKELKIPSIIGTKIIRSITFLLFFIIPCIAGLIYVKFYIDKLQKPLVFISSLSVIRTYAYQVIGFSLRYVGESLNIFDINNNTNKEPPKSLGNTWDTKKQLEYILGITTQALQDFGSIRMFEEDNEYLNQARNLIFQNTIPYVYYTSPTNRTTTNISIQAAVLDFTIQQKMILTGNNFASSILSSGTILNPINNASPISNNIRDAMTFMIEYINSNYIDANKIGKIVLVILILVEILVFEITLVIQLKMMNSNKQEAYQCLFSIPKNVISELGDNKKKKNMDNQAEEMNKQDENILKIFNSGGSSGNQFSDSLLIIIGTQLIILVIIITTILFVQFVITSTRIIRNLAPHLYYLLASYSMLLSSLNWLHIILYEFGGYPIPTVDFNKSLSNMLYVSERSKYYYHLIASGGTSNTEIPFKGFIDGVRRSSPLNCSLADSFLKKKVQSLTNISTFMNLLSNSDGDEGEFPEILDCLPVDMLFVLVEPIILYSIYPYQMGETSTLDPKKSIYVALWSSMISPLYDLFFEPTHNQIMPAINDELSSNKIIFIPAIVGLLCISIIFEIILYFQIMSIDEHIRSVLSLLLHCNPSVIFSSNKISRVLIGDFSTRQSDTLDRNSNFFDTVFTCLPDAIMYANTDMIIQGANQSCQSIFGEVEFVGKSIKDFFMSSKFNGNIESLFTLVNSNPTEEISYKNEQGNDLILMATSMIACGKFVISCRNVTQSHNYNMLILEEKQNSDKLLSTILPPSLVSRVQEGEKNISFSVQSASILFSDIVSFTPWCGSLPPEKVMSTLNILFKRMDKILDTKKTMTKIKCIGDCYMAAGGIFAEINQPAVHAKEVVSFGLQSINEIKSINQEIHENLRIRVGINTGGPIVAGVLGIGKPTFEIIGPTINRAQQMEQNGVPMKVHISMSVYELICGLNFKFCNRRTIECKNEKVETYLVEP